MKKPRQLWLHSIKDEAINFNFTCMTSTTLVSNKYNKIYACRGLLALSYLLLRFFFGGVIKNELYFNISLLCDWSFGVPLLGRRRHLQARLENAETRRNSDPSASTAIAEPSMTESSRGGSGLWDIRLWTCTCLLYTSRCV